MRKETHGVRNLSRLKPVGRNIGEPGLPL
ncbi:hypothetical protein SAMN05660903_03048 [Salegentibacter salinarum]|nr:hypothetical protein SAMN05660903_03048 [Salegentibacter salinarum]